MPGVRLILTLHNHQPVGNFGGVFEAAFRDSYQPFLDVMADFPALPFVLHTSGPLLEWLVAHRPDYVARLRTLAESGRVEILGGPSQEPILTMIPRRDVVGQIRSYTGFLREHLGQPVRGMWMPERVWEQHLVSALVEAGIEYTALDDFHFRSAGLNEDELHGYYLTEDDGRLLKVFPNSERMRYLVPWRDPHEAIDYLRGLAHQHPGAVVVCADDGEKFGAWPNTFDHVYTHGWLRRFCQLLTENLDWLQVTTFARAVDETLPVGKVYLPDSSYREMTEWVLPPGRSQQYQAALRQAEGQPATEALKGFVRAGGFWRNFKARYAESDEMYSRMLTVSSRLDRLQSVSGVDPELLAEARQALYRGQCNCPYWHGAFGGLYLPHLRNAIYANLIAADRALDAAEGRRGAWAELTVGDFNLDARQEVRLDTESLTAFVRPATGGHLYELDVKRVGTNLLATLDRRPEAYHETIAAAARGESTADGRPAVSDQVKFKQANLERLLQYDRHPRKAFVDHFYPADVRLDDLAACHDLERGDFATGAYLARVLRESEFVQLTLERPGHADGYPIRIQKVLRATAGVPGLAVTYTLTELPEGVPLHFGVELNLAAMAGRADDRYFTAADGSRLGVLASTHDLPEVERLSLTDEWLDLTVGLSWSRPAPVWILPIETVSQSEGGFEGVFQSTSVTPHWTIVADATRQWQVRIQLELTPAQTLAWQESVSHHPERVTVG